MRFLLPLKSLVVIHNQQICLHAREWNYHFNFSISSTIFQHLHWCVYSYSRHACPLCVVISCPCMIYAKPTKNGCKGRWWAAFSSIVRLTLLDSCPPIELLAGRLRWRSLVSKQSWYSIRSAEDWALSPSLCLCWCPLLCGSLGVSRRIKPHHENAHILFIGRSDVFWLCMAGMMCSVYKGRFMIHLARKGPSPASSPRIFSSAPLRAT